MDNKQDLNVSNWNTWDAYIHGIDICEFLELPPNDPDVVYNAMINRFTKTFIGDMVSEKG